VHAETKALKGCTDPSELYRKIPSQVNPGSFAQIYSCACVRTFIELPGAGVLPRNARLLEGRPLLYSFAGSITGVSGPVYAAAVKPSDDDEDALLEDMSMG
jgi:hypothetical protein